MLKLQRRITKCSICRYVDSNPVLAKNLRLRLTLGVHTLIFRARSPTASNVNDVCKTVITVKEGSVGPQLVYCPPPTEIQLQPNELQKSVIWKEPVFKPQRPLKHIIRSNEPGAQFGAGTHRVTYTAIDVDNHQAKCEFNINIRPSGKIISFYSLLYPMRNYDINNKYFYFCK